MPHMPLMFSSLLFFEFCRDERRLVAVRRKIVADQENAQTDQLNMLIENWETKFESRENDSRVVREHTASSKLCRFFNKRQRTIAAIYWENIISVLFHTVFSIMVNDNKVLKNDF